jgi:hypothetical protein
MDNITLAPSATAWASRSSWRDCLSQPSQTATVSFMATILVIEDEPLRRNTGLQFGTGRIHGRTAPWHPGLEQAATFSPTDHTLTLCCRGLDGFSVCPGDHARAQCRFILTALKMRPIALRD